MSFAFFLQAEDGIRDYKVTGVQTCALPISRLTGTLLPGGTLMLVTVAARPGILSASLRPALFKGTALTLTTADSRSEERRVGEEGISPWWGADSMEGRKDWVCYTV